MFKNRAVGAEDRDKRSKEPVWLSTHLRDSQPERERERELLDTQFHHVYLLNVRAGV